MNINFNDQDIIFIYGQFMKKIEKLNQIKSTPNCPIDHKSINQEIQLYQSVIDKILEVRPNIKKLDSYF